MQLFCTRVWRTCYFLINFWDSKRFQLAMYAVFHEESESAVRIDRFLRPEEQTKKNQPTGVSISYGKISYHTPPPYVFKQFNIFKSNF